MKQSFSIFRNKSIAMTTCSLLLSSTLCVGSSFAFERNITRTGSNGFSASKSVNTTRTSQGYNRNTTVTGVNGNSASSSSSAARTDSGYNRSTTVTGPQGNSGTRNVSGSWDAATKTWTKTANTTR